MSVNCVIDDFSGSKKLRETVPLPLSRLLLILDYLLHHFYDPPAALMQQVSADIALKQTIMALIWG